MIAFAPEKTVTRSTLQAFLQSRVVEPPQPKKRQVSTSLLMHLDGMYGLARDVGAESKRDGAKIAFSLLEITLRLSWGTVKGKLDSAVNPALVPFKLFQTRWLTKEQHLALLKVVTDGPAKENYVPLMEAAKAQLQWLAK